MPGRATLRRRRIDAELSTMVDEVIHEDTAKRHDAGQRVEDAVAPMLMDQTAASWSSRRCEMGGFGSAALLSNLSTNSAWTRRPRAQYRLADKLLGGDDGGAARGQLRDMRGETAEGHRFFVRLPGKTGFRHALEDPAGGGGLFVKLQLKQLGDGHGSQRKPFRFSCATGG